MKREIRDQVNPAMDRRSFLGRSARGAGLVVAAAAAVKFGRLPAQGAANPLELNLEAGKKVDPNLIRYEEVARFNCPDAEPRRISYGPGAQLCIASGKQVSVMSLSGDVLSAVPVSEPARCAAVDSEGKLFVGLRDHVEVFSRDGKPLGKWASAGPKSWLSGIACGAEDLFVADSGSRTVFRYDKSGKLKNRIGVKDKERSVPGLIIPSPYLDVDLGKDGLLRVNNFGRHCVETYTFDGDLEHSWGKVSGGIEGFCGCCNPVSVSMLPGGAFVTCEKGLPRVKVYSDAGDFQCVVAGVESFPENARSAVPSRGTDCKLGGLDAAVDPEGRVYVLDLIAARVVVFKPKA